MQVPRCVPGVLVAPQSGWYFAAAVQASTHVVPAPDVLVDVKYLREANGDVNMVPMWCVHNTRAVQNPTPF